MGRRQGIRPGRRKRGMKKTAVLTRIVLPVLVLFCLSGCAGRSRVIVLDAPYERVWQSCLDVSKETEGPGKSTVKMFGVEVHKDGVYEDKGKICFTTSDLFLIHVENEVRLKELKEGEVEVSVKSLTRGFFLPGTSRNKKFEREILRKIEEKLSGED